MKKRIALLFLTSALFLSLCACSSISDEKSNHSPFSASQSTVQTYTDGFQADGRLHVYLVGDAEKVLTPQSSFIDYIVYYKENRHLIISMNEKDYVYANVSSTEWEGFKNAESPGKYYNSVFKGKSDYYVNGYDGTNGSLIIMERVG